MIIKTTEQQRLEQVLRAILSDAIDKRHVITRAEAGGKVGDFAAMVALCCDPETGTLFYAVSEGESVFSFCEEDIRRIAARVPTEESDSVIDRWMASDLAKGGDPTTYWSRKAAAISGGDDVENVPSIAETIVALRQRAERAEYSAKRLDALARLFDEKAEWSAQTFGPGNTYNRVVKHIRKELEEIESKPHDLKEWVDVVLLAFDGAWRSAGANGYEFVTALLAKYQENLTRRWPDWRTLAPDQVAEHVRENKVSTMPAPPDKE